MDGVLAHSLIFGTRATPSLEYVIYSRILSFSNRVLNHPCEDIKFLFHNSVHNSNSSFANNLKTIYHKLNTNNDIACTYKAAKIKAICKAKGYGEDGPDIINSLLEMIDIRNSHLLCNLDYNEITNCLLALCTG